MADELNNFRQKYPEYNDVDDSTLSGMLAEKYPDAYGDLPGKVEPVGEVQPETEQSGFFDPAMETVKNIGQVYPVAETAAQVATSAYGVPISGLAGMFALPFGLEKAGKTVEAVQKALVYEPQTERGKQLSETVAYPFEKLEQAASFVGQKLEESGHPDLAAAVHTAITGAPAVVGGKMAIKKSPVRSLSTIDTEMSATIKKGVNKAIRPSVAKKQTRGQVDKYFKQAESAIEEIVKNQENLALVDETGATVKGLPKSLDQFTQAIEQTKRNIFEEYDSLAKETGAAKTRRPLKPNLLKGEKIIFDKSGKGISIESPLEKGLGKSTRPIRYPIQKDETVIFDKSGKGVSIERKLDTGLEKSTRPLSPKLLKDEKIIFDPEGKGIAIEKPVAIDLNLMSKELKTVINNKILQDLSPETIQYAQMRIESMKGRGKYSAVETQEAIQFLNQTLEKFYRDPSPAMKGQALVDSVIANNLRAQLDSVIQKSTGKEYSTLKKKYGDLKTIEGDVVKRSIVDARKNNKGLIDFSDIFSGHQIIKGMIAKEPAAIAGGVAAKGIANTYRWINDPNKIVKGLFSDVEKLSQKRGVYETKIRSQPEPGPLQTDLGESASGFIERYKAGGFSPKQIRAFDELRKRGKI